MTLGEESKAGKAEGCAVEEAIPQPGGWWHSNLLLSILFSAVGLAPHIPFPEHQDPLADPHRRAPPAPAAP